MNKKKIFAIICAVLAIILVIGISSFAGPCPVPEGEKPMKCNWTQAALQGIGVVMAVSALIRVFVVDRKISMGISIVELLNTIYGFSLVTFLIGTCMHAEMVCNTAMKPFVFIILGLYGIFAILSLMANRTE